METNLQTIPPPTPPAVSAVTDLSARVVQLARMIERLPPGNYEISIEKQEMRAQDWNIEIVRTEKIVHANLSKYMPE